jgi:hypothetical protein
MAKAPITPKPHWIEIAFGGAKDVENARHCRKRSDQAPVRPGHRAAAESHGKNDHGQGKEHAKQAQQHAQNADTHSKTANNKSAQQG